MSPLESAKDTASFASGLCSSPDERSVPYLLSGILDALIAIAERMPIPAADPAPERRSEAQRSEGK